MKKMRINSKNSKGGVVREFLRDKSAGSILEYGLLVGFSIFIFLLIVSIILNVFGWTNGQISDFFNIIG